MGVGVGCVLGVASRSWRSTLRVGVPTVLAGLLPGSEALPSTPLPAASRVMNPLRDYPPLKPPLARIFYVKELWLDEMFLMALAQ